MALELETAKQILESLFHDVAGYEISHRQRAGLSSNDRSTTYGEIVPGTFHQMLQAVAPKANDVFYDLGSGTGKPVFFAALTFPFRKAVGIELLAEMGAQARKVLERFHRDVAPTRFTEWPAPEIELLDGDFLTADLSTADVVFTHSTCFERTLVRQLSVKLTELKHGARVIAIGQRLVNEALIFRQSRVFAMDWGESFATFYERR